MAETRGSRGVLWDLDGTLIDSAGLHFRAWRETLLAHGREHTPEDFAHYFGKRNDHILRSIFGATLSDEESLRIADAKEERFRGLVRDHGLEAVPGALPWLARLHEAGLLQALASSAPRRNITVSIEALGFDRYLDAVVSAEEVDEGKPDPAIFLAAARRLGVAPERCVVVEDSPAGLEGARRAGMGSVGILSDHYPSLDADLVIPSLSALPLDAFDELLGE